MAELTIPDFPDEVYRDLHARAIQHGNSIAAEATAGIAWVVASRRTSGPPSAGTCRRRRNRGAA
ncbi:FitA-like ribbon-helix-helix domain-containing protein [Nocardia sp. KC 131]|uniref:FitA-like ribbon-helix-helix domain-containing protein n=1 Tax=Nocardia arseniciresistens TaxID=3392119 RepID=UPI00398E4119